MCVCSGAPTTTAVTYVCVQRCTNDHSGNGAEWCATSVTRDGAVIPGEWGDCDFDNIHCRYSAPGFIVLVLT